MLSDQLLRRACLHCRPLKVFQCERNVAACLPLSVSGASAAQLDFNQSTLRFHDRQDGTWRLDLSSDGARLRR